MKQKKIFDTALATALLDEARSHLDSMSSGCECEDIGFRCIGCLVTEIEKFLKSGKKSK